ncbi:hypothetical protein [Streptomyces sp. NPDC058268]|uniref:hypothetical protein n=1 Tax=Streptomyces sp. NPDC058268 TaxID=3346413 RepID=UPI0036EF5328
MTTIDIKGLDWAAVLAELFNATQPYGMGAKAPDVKKKITVEQAQEFLDSVKPRAITEPPRPGKAYVEFGGGVHTGRYLYGHSLELVFDQDTVEVGHYNHDNGQGLAEQVIARLRESGEGGSSG